MLRYLVAYVLVLSMALLSTTLPSAEGWRRVGWRPGHVQLGLAVALFLGAAAPLVLSYLVWILPRALVVRPTGCSAAGGARVPAWDVR